MTDSPEPRRRDVIHLATIATATVGLGVLGVTVLRSSGGSRQTRQPDMLVDVTTIPEGSQIKFLLRTKPIFIRHRTEVEIVSAQSASLDDLPDPISDTDRLRATADGKVNPRFLVVHGVCSHFGCVPVAEAGDYDGWYCPCHGSHFDTSGRVRKGPAPTNMTVPEYKWEDPTTLRFRVPLQQFSDAQAEELRCPDHEHA